MKKTLSKILSILLVVLMGAGASILPVIHAEYAASAGDDNYLEFENGIYAEEEENDISGFTGEELHTVSADFANSDRARMSSLAYSASGYKSYTSSDISIFKTIPNKTIGGLACTSMQGMNVGTTYIYTAKIHASNERASIIRTNSNTGAQDEMRYFSSPSATTASSCNTLGHANDLTVVTNTENGSSVNYMYVATCVANTTVARLKINGTGLYFTGYFKTVKSNGSALTVSAIRGIKHTGGYQYFLVKAGMDFYTFRVPEGASGGSASSPTQVTCYKAFSIDTRNALFALSSSSYGTLDNLETWINQGFGYSSDQSAIYVPIYKSNMNGSSANDNAILVYNVSGLLTTALLDANKDYTRLLFPCTLTFRFQDTSQSLFELESCGLRTGQGTTGDLKLYFNTNASSAAKEGIYKVNYNRGSMALVPIANEDSVVYTVKYDGNGGTVPSDTASYFKMSATRHIRGISARLRPNTFTKSGNTFIGWYLTRSSDGKWLYFDTDGTARWYTKGSQPIGSRLALYEDKRKVSQLTGVDGDTVTCYAQWKPNSTGTTSYYIRYDANGGTGSMSDTKVVYGTSTNIKTNVFTRPGYFFSGWIAHRMSDNSWIYKDSSALTDKWIAVGGSTSGYFLKAYSNGCGVAKTSSKDRDIITFYAVWTRITDAVSPTTISAGTDFSFGGTITGAGLYEVKLVITDASGVEKVSKAVNPKANSYNIAGLNSSVTTANLARGSYTYKLYVTTLNAGTSKTTVTLISQPFTVT